jgi:glycosyltransferase involved in cell wall biosynthesis
MRIGVMLRHYGQHGGGVKVYTHNLLREMLAIDAPHEFVLLYNDPKFIGTYADGNRVNEIAIKAPSIFMWDQLAVPRVIREEKLDLIFNPKYSIPLTAKCKTVYVCHGMNWAVLRLPKPWYDYVSHRFLIPLYARKADAIIAVSNTTKQNMVDHFKLPPEHIHTVYHGVADRFKQAIPGDILDDIRSQYKLPEQYFLYTGQIYPPKNFGRLLKAYARVGPSLGIALVVVGEQRWFYKKELALIDQLGISSWVVSLGWINHENLPSIYALAKALIFPSLYESFGLPLVEAMAVGTPVVTSNRYATKELADGAGILVDPESVDSIAEGLRKVTYDNGIRKQLIEAGRERARAFCWKKCAHKTIQIFESLFTS